MSPKPLLKSQKYRTCYAGRGLRSGVAVRGSKSEKGPAAKAVGRIAPTGRTDPKAPAGPVMQTKDKAMR